MTNELERMVLFWMVGISILMTWTFFVGYMNPSRTVLVNINAYGEADFEAVLLIAMWAVSIPMIIRMYRRI